MRIVTRQGLAVGALSNYFGRQSGFTRNGHRTVYLILNILKTRKGNRISVIGVAHQHWLRLMPLVLCLLILIWIYKALSYSKSSDQHMTGRRYLRIVHCFILASLRIPRITRSSWIVRGISFSLLLRLHLLQLHNSIFLLLWLQFPNIQLFFTILLFVLYVILCFLQNEFGFG